MLKSLRNHKAGSAACCYYHNQPEDRYREKKIKSLMVIK